MKSDSDIKTAVEAALRWSREIDETHIATKVNKAVAPTGVTCSLDFPFDSGSTIDLDRLEAPDLNRGKAVGLEVA
jgi:hypothetical protein